MKHTRTQPWLLSIVVAAIAGFSCAATLFGEERLPAALLKNGSSVRAAFQKVVAQANPSIVSVIAEGKQNALGVIIDSDGHILTKASELHERNRCRLHDGRSFDATIVGIVEQYDLAMLKIDAGMVPAIEWTTGGDPAVGDWLATPGSDELPVAVGVSSVTRRMIPPERGMLGVQLTNDERGARVTHVVQESGAARAGLKNGDVVIKIGEQRVENAAALEKLLRALAPGDAVNLVVLREENEVTLKATLGRGFGSVNNRTNWMNRMGGRLSQRRAGFAIALQHDSVLEPEECGGAIVDLSGRAVGLNIARAGRVETYAIPADVLQPLIADLRSGRYALPPRREPLIAPLPAIRDDIPPMLPSHP